MALLLARFPFHDQWAALAFAVFSLTDTADGQIARRYGRVTELGKFLDPLADKLFILSVLVILVQERMLPAWIVVIIFARELLITLLRSVGLGQGRVIAASGWGKTKTVTQSAAVGLVILARPYQWLEPYALLAIAAALLFTIWSGLDYLWRFRHVIFQPAPLAVMRRPLPAIAGSPHEVDLAAAVTGVLGPASDGTEKPVGITFIAVADPESARVNRYQWKGDRAENRRLLVEAALQMALAAIVREAGVNE